MDSIDRPNMTARSAREAGRNLLPFSPAGKRGTAKGDPTMKSLKGHFKFTFDITLKRPKDDLLRAPLVRFPLLQAGADPFLYARLKLHRFKYFSELHDSNIS